MDLFHIVEPSGPSDKASLEKGIKTLKNLGFSVRYEPKQQDDTWPYTSSGRTQRLDEIQTALCSEATFVFAGRGGYGASELLPLLDWNRIAAATKKHLVGFSDITSLQMALYSKLGWSSVHAPMPGSKLWDENAEDVSNLISIIQTPHLKHKLQTELLYGKPDSTEGVLVGGCFAVLTNLIGTEYLSLSENDKILFLEDTNETPPRLLRYWCQWVQSGLLRGVKAVILGHLDYLCDAENYQSTKSKLACMMGEMAGIPVLGSEIFGHGQPNFPVGIGVKATLDEKGLLTWQLN